MCTCAKQFAFSEMATLISEIRYRKVNFFVVFFHLSTIVLHQKLTELID